MATVDIKKYHEKGTQSKTVQKAQQYAKDISTHIDGSLPEKLVSDRRPNEGRTRMSTGKDLAGRDPSDVFGRNLVAQ